MHGLINKSIQSFLCDSFGGAAWQEIAQQSGVAQQLGPDGFEAMQTYDDSLTDAVISAAVAVLKRPRDCLLEDLGTYLISNERLEALRRLLRFGGVSFTDFLYSLDDLQGRSRLAVPELALPELALDEVGPGQFTLTCRGCSFGFGFVLVGVLRALADDYGALAVLEHLGTSADATESVISIEVHDPAFHAGRRFDLAVEVR
ncbi:heme NO-binding domain-containing protein [Pararhodobacter sp.]|uniref:heme NO-binding domain-containing protein n=1 Tax=Pararhodobacter sp. TaxID=2127056 RepID=UPI002AFE4014|nr:heme NO-binding domain-containing protein [Pararhodobacter sp.]